MEYDDFSNYANWVNDVDDSGDKELFNEIVSCIDSESYRSASIMIWILCAESLYGRLKQLSMGNRKLKDDLINWEEHDKNEADLLDLCKSYDLIDNIDFNHLNSIRDARNTYAHPNYVAPTKNQVLAYLFFALNSVLSKSSKYSYLEAKNLIELLLRDPYQLGNRNNAQIKTYSRNFISKLNSNIHKPILKLLFKLTEEIFEDFEPEKQKCLDIGLILIKELILISSNLINEEICGEFLNTSKVTACHVFSEVEIWRLLDSNTQYKTFMYSSKFEDEILSEIDFLNKFNKLHENELLNQDLIGKFDEILIENSPDIVLNSEISPDMQFNKLIKDLKSYDWYVQNPAAKIIKQLNFNKFSNNQLEIIGRNLLQAAHGGSWESQRTINNLLFIYDNENVPESIINGIVLEIFVNDDNEFRFKENYFEVIIRKISIDDKFNSIYLHLVDKIKDSFVKNDRFYHYTNSIDCIRFFNRNLRIEKINGIIKAIKESRCNSINKLMYENPDKILEIKPSEYIAPYVFKCLDEVDQNTFGDLVEENVFKFIKFFSDYGYVLNKRKYSHVDINFDLIKQFYGLEGIKNIVQDKMEENISKEDNEFGKIFLEDVEQYLSKEY